MVTTEYYGVRTTFPRFCRSAASKLGSMDLMCVGLLELEYRNDIAVKSELKKQKCVEAVQTRNGSRNVTEKDSDASETDQDDDDWGKPRGVYEVEKILDRCNFGNGEVYFLVKWKFWQPKYNTWEPAEHLDCQKRIEKYLDRVVYRKEEKLVDKVIESVVEPTKANLEYFFQSLMKEKNKQLLIVHSERKLRSMACSLGKRKKENREESEERFKKALLLKYLFVRRSRQLVALKEWQEEMNGLSHDPAPIIVENLFDLEGPPDNFFYVNQYIPGPNVIIPDDPPVGCKCKTCDRKSLCCSSLATFRFAYTVQGCLRVSPNMPIYECNKRCRCKSNCMNRVVQNGRKVKLCIFRTTDNRGWGVKALEDIKKGTYMGTYFGEVIDNTDAEARIEKYQGNQHTYLFDMDYNGANYKYTVDATDYGTVSRFINHSCNPNLTVCFVWIDCLDPSLPHLAFFSADFISAGQELTIDYVGDPSRMDANVLRKTKPCRCGSVHCKKFVF